MKYLINIKFTLCLLCCLSLHNLSAQVELDLKGCGQSSAKYLVKVNVDALAYAWNTLCPTSANEPSVLFSYTKYSEKEIDGPIEKIEYIEQCVGGNWFWGPGGIKVTHNGGRETFLRSVGNSIDNDRLNNHNNASISSKIVSIKRVDGVEESDCVYGGPEPQFPGRPECSKNCIRYRTNFGEDSWKTICVNNSEENIGGAIPRVVQKLKDGYYVFDLYIADRDGNEILAGKDLSRFPEAQIGYTNGSNAETGCVGWQNLSIITLTDEAGDRLRAGGCTFIKEGPGTNAGKIFCSRCEPGQQLIIEKVLNEGVFLISGVVLLSFGKNTIGSGITKIGAGASVTRVISGIPKNISENICQDYTAPTGKSVNTPEENKSESNVLDFNLFVTPNPAKDHIYLHYQFLKNKSFTVFVSDLQGRQVVHKNYGQKDSKMHKEYIDISHLSPGIYILGLDQGNGNIKQTKFVVQ